MKASLPRLSATEEHQLFSQLRAGETSVRDQIIRANFGLAISVAMRYRSTGAPMEDILQESMSGLIRSVAMYDPTLGYRFSTYAVRVIRTTIMRALDAQLRTIRLPSSFLHARWQMSLKKAELTGQLHRSPTDAELAVAMGASASKIARLRSIKDEMLPLCPEGMAREGSSSPRAVSYADVPADEAVDPLRALICEESYSGVLDELNDREKEVLRLRFGLDGRSAHTNAEIGRVLGVSSARAGQVAKAALRKCAIRLSVALLPQDEGGRRRS
jgi:RNA polymerase primary sigma factor